MTIRITTCQRCARRFGHYRPHDPPRLCADCNFDDRIEPARRAAARHRAARKSEREARRRQRGQR